MAASVIWKFPLNTMDLTVLMPKGAEVLTVQMQGQLPRNRVTLWALVDPGAEPVPRTFAIIGTGEEYETQRPVTYVGTVQTVEGFVWHVFEVLDLAVA